MRLKSRISRWSGLLLTTVVATTVGLVGCGGGGSTDSPPSALTPIVNIAPIPNAGPDQSVLANAIVTLDGSASSDANSDSLTYTWTLTAKPPGSAATLANPTSAKPTFIADAAGSYVATVVVNDGKINSNPDTVIITVSVDNARPVANAGVAQTLVAGSVVILDGRASSDANSDPLTYAWTLTAKPPGSAAVLIQPTSAKPSFTTDLFGTYDVALIVNDGKIDSEVATVSITATAPPIPLSATSLYITYPTSRDEGVRLSNATAALAIPASESAFAAIAANDNGWIMRATYSRQGLFKVPVSKGYLYQFSSSSFWGPCLAVHDEAGYQLALKCAPPSSDISGVSIKLLAIQTGFVYVDVSSQVSPVFKNADLVIDVNPDSKGLDSGQQVVLSAFGSARNYVTAFYGGEGNDRIDVKNTPSATIYGGAGDDVIEIGESNFATAPIVDGGNGNDTLVVNFASQGVTLVRSALYGAGTWEPGPLTDAHGLCKTYPVVIPCAAISADIRFRNIERIQFTDKTLDVTAMPGYR